ncbi:YggS family pyridoxal phosphate-dependent enzyme [Nakamurella sp. GG22]
MTVPDGDPMLERLHRVRSQIDDAAVAAGRGPSEVRLLLATKTQSADRISTALRAGFTLIGENRVQEVVGKAADLASIPHETHFIGHLQANKINQLLDHISCLETLDSPELARKLDQRLDARDRDLDVLIQVNVSGEQSKSGVPPEAAVDLLAAVATCPRLTVRGYMTIGLNSDDLGAVRAGYRLLARLRDSAMADGVPGAAAAMELSMGMSGDFAAAIAEGATIVRVGSAIFGRRPAAG